MKIHHLMGGVMAAVTLLCAVTSQAKTVTTRTTVYEMDMPRGEKIDFYNFDSNNDGILSATEIGQNVFYLFDRDGNEVIDNLEFGRSEIMTLIPMRRETVRSVDLNDDGLAEQAAYDYDTFVRASRLIAFDDNRDGLSAEEFIDVGFLDMDANDSGAIELDEWERAYSNQVIYNHNLDAHYNG